MKFRIIKSCLARFSGIFALGTPSNIHGTAISYRCAKFGAFVNSVTILTLRDLTIKDTSMFAHFRSTSEAYRACKMIRNKLVYRPSYAAVGMICLTKCRTQFKSSDQCDYDVNYLQKPLQLKDFARGRQYPV